MTCPGRSQLIFEQDLQGLHLSFEGLIEEMICKTEKNQFVSKFLVSNPLFSLKMKMMVLLRIQGLEKVEGELLDFDT